MLRDSQGPHGLTLMPPEFTTVFVALLLQDAEIPEDAPAVSQSVC